VLLRRVGTLESVTEQYRANAAPRERPDYPGEFLGLPESGPGAVASMSRRIIALFIDWLLCTFIVAALIRPTHGDAEYWTLLVFAAQDLVLTALTGFTIGKRLLGIRVVRLDGHLVGPLWGVLRTFLLLIVIPALLLNRDLRGLHDRASNTVVVRV
jgi:uncharacterized RDD family membrane protein YckC